LQGIQVSQNCHRFRWVYCQLEILKRLLSESDIRIALSQLPRTMDETYERVLATIPQGTRDMAYRTLQLLATDYITTLRQLIKALLVATDQEALVPARRPLKPFAPLQACSVRIYK
jgi:hypothetical protein